MNRSPDTLEAPTPETPTPYPAFPRERPRVALLAPEISQAEAPFVVGEVAALRELGLDVRLMALRRSRASGSTPEAALLADETETLLDRPLALLGNALLFALTSPRATLRVLRPALRDAVLGEVPRLSRRPLVLLAYVAGLALARRLRACGAERLHVHSAGAAATIGMYAAAAAEVPFGLTVHTSDLLGEPSLLSEKARRADPVITTSEANRARLTREAGAAGACAVVVPPSVDTQALPFEPSLSLDLDERSPRAFAFGRLAPGSGFDVLIAALAHLRHERPGLRLEIAGDGPERAALLEQARALEVGDRVVLLGEVAQGEVWRRLCRASLFVLPSRAFSRECGDAIPPALLEAMSLGLPVVASHVADIVEVVRPDRDAVVVAPGDARALAAGIDRLLGAPRLRERLAASARARVEAGHDRRRNVSRLLGALLVAER